MRRKPIVIQLQQQLLHKGITVCLLPQITKKEKKTLQSTTVVTNDIYYRHTRVQRVFFTWKVRYTAQVMLETDQFICQQLKTLAAWLKKWAFLSHYFYNDYFQ